MVNIDPGGFRGERADRQARDERDSFENATNRHAIAGDMNSPKKQHSFQRRTDAL